MQPKLRPGAFGSYPGVEFDGANDILRIPDSEALHLGTRDFIVEVVFLRPTILAVGSLFAKQAPSAPFRGIGLFAEAVIGSQPAEHLVVQLDVDHPILLAAEVPIGGRAYLLGIHRSSYHEFSMRLDGRLVGSRLLEQGSVIDASATGADALIGGGRDVGQSLRGAIAEIVVAADPTATDVEQLERYLSRRCNAALELP